MAIVGIVAFVWIDFYHVHITHLRSPVCLLDYLPPPCSCNLSVHVLLFQFTTSLTTHRHSHVWFTRLLSLHFLFTRVRQRRRRWCTCLSCLGVWMCVGGSLSPWCVCAHITLWVVHVLPLESVWQLKRDFPYFSWRCFSFFDVCALLLVSLWRPVWMLDLKFAKCKMTIESRDILKEGDLFDIFKKGQMRLQNVLNFPEMSTLSKVRTFLESGDILFDPRFFLVVWEARFGFSVKVKFRSRLE